MQQNTLLESYLRQLKLPTFAQNYAAIASDAAGTGLSCERYLLVPLAKPNSPSEM